MMRIHEFNNVLKQYAMDLLQVEEYYRNANIEHVEIFIQTWGSTALGFGGIGGSAITFATTIVVFCNSTASIFFGGKRAYKVPANDKGKYPENLWDDIKNKNIADVASYKERYGIV